MIISRNGDALSVESGIVVHGCNAQGVMGSGIAHQVKSRFPQAFQLYLNDYETVGLKPGQISFIAVGPTKYIVNAITQEFYGREQKQYTSYEAVRECFKQVNSLAKSFGLSVNFPLIGCGLGRGSWDVVSEIIDEEIDDNIEKILWLNHG